MVASERKVKPGDPFKCDSCGAMVFVSEKLHAVVCSDYRAFPELVKGSHEYYEIYKRDQAHELAHPVKPKRGRKS